VRKSFEYIVVVRTYIRILFVVSFSIYTYIHTYRCEEERKEKMSGKGIKLRYVAPGRFIRATGELKKSKRRRAGGQTNRFFVLTNNAIYHFRRTSPVVRTYHPIRIVRETTTTVGTYLLRSRLSVYISPPSGRLTPPTRPFPPPHTPRRRHGTFHSDPSDSVRERIDLWTFFRSAFAER